ncbi:hypothetical protein B0T09DRAFT_15301 [Sordaria sp. MPI-SDFR-AT-0083]|nr:hypothetical protein B0T09DRAFT_15301 [Sordaria sp. MPI-SDFR-AT-0083]
MPWEAKRWLGRGYLALLGLLSGDVSHSISSTACNRLARSQLPVRHHRHLSSLLLCPYSSVQTQTGEHRARKQQSPTTVTVTYYPSLTGKQATAWWKSKERNAMEKTNQYQHENPSAHSAHLGCAVTMKKVGADPRRDLASMIASATQKAIVSAG